MFVLAQRRSHTPIRALLAACLGLAAAGVALAQGGSLFPEPFVIEHHLVQNDGDGSRFESAPVTDYYGGSWIVSVRPDGSRLIVDLARREVTEVRAEQGTFWTVSFDHLGQLAADLARVERRAAADAAAAAAAGGASSSRAASASSGDEPPELVIEELPATGGAAAAGHRAAGGSSVAGAVAQRPGVQHLRVVERQRAADPDAGVEVWLDRTVQMRPAAVDALAAFESQVLGAAARSATAGAGTRGSAANATAADRAAAAQSAAPDPVSRHLAAARRYAAGAVPVRTVRSFTAAGAGSVHGRIEDVATRFERLDDFPRDLLAIPEGLRRVSHPAEAVIDFLEAENARDRALIEAAARNAAGGGGGR